MPFSNPFTSRKNKEDKRASAMYPPGFHNGSVVDLEWHSPHVNEPRRSTHDPIMELNFGFGSQRHNSSSSQSLKNVQQYLKGYDASSSSDNNGDATLAPYTPSPQPSKPARYYSHALSNEDKVALAHGELNHNLQAWAPEDLVKHHESRKSLVPSGLGSSKLLKMEAFAKIEEEKQHSQRALDKKATQSMYDLRSASALAAQPSRHAAASPPLIPTTRRKYSWEADHAPSTPHQNVRTAGGTHSGYFSFQPGREVLSTPTSRSSSRVPSSGLSSPLSNKDTDYQRNPDTTFDTFLAPHKSGKGEAYRGAQNAKKSKTQSKARASEDFGMGVPGTAKEKTLRRFTKMSSTPNLRQRFSRAELRKGQGQDVPDVPALP